MASDVQTRRFVRTRDGKSEFCELSWSGLEVEVVRGKVGTPGLARESAFESPAERDEFLERQLGRLGKEGFVEAPLDSGSADDDADDSEDATLATRIAQSRKRTAWVPVLEEGEGPDTGSRFGGRPWISPLSPWPDCGHCGLPSHFLVQLDTRSLPEPFRSEIPAGLIQLFICQRLCQSKDGWDPFSKVTTARYVTGVGGGALAPPAPDLIYPAKRITDWRSHDDYPRYAELAVMEGLETALTVSEVMEERRQQSLAGEKLGGWPHWIQDVMYPRCRECRHQMDPWLQIDTNHTLPVQWGDSGAGWLYRCSKCGTMTFAWQCC